MCSFPLVRCETANANTLDEAARKSLLQVFGGLEEISSILASLPKTKTRLRHPINRDCRRLAYWWTAYCFFASLQEHLSLEQMEWLASQQLGYTRHSAMDGYCSLLGTGGVSILRKVKKRAQQARSSLGLSGATCSHSMSMPPAFRQSKGGERSL